jgi:Mg2+/Co2+ transporter CorB
MNAKDLVLLVLLALSLGLSAFFAGSETALVSLTRIDLQRLREKGDRRGPILRNLKAHTSRLLATILIGQNLFMATASSLATLLATAWLGETYGAPAAILFSTVVLFIFAEMTPKSIAAGAP